MKRVFCALGMATLVIAADWPVHRGNEAQTAFTADALPDTIAVRWTLATERPIEGAAAIVDGMVYVGSSDLFALDLMSGKQKWKFPSGVIKAPVSVHDGRVYGGNDDGVMHCVDANKGQQIWKFESGAEITSGCAFAGNDVLFGTGDEQIHCVNRADGKERWQFQIVGGPVFGTPLVLGNRVFVSGCDRVMHELDLTTGKEKNQVELGGQVAAAPAYAAGRIYVTTMAAEAIAVVADRMAVAWRFESRKRQPFFAAPAVTENLLIAAARDGRVYGIERATGKEAWTYLAGQRIDSSPVVAGSRVYVGSFDKHLHVLDLGSGRQVQKLPLGGAIIASPAIGGGCLVVGTDKGTVCCLGQAK